MTLYVSGAARPVLRYAAGFPGVSARLVALPALAAWTLLAVTAAFEPGADICLGYRPLASGRFAAAMQAAFGSLSLAALASPVLLMMLAMALPLAWRPAAQVSARSFRRNAEAAALLFTLTFAAVWAALLLPMTALAVTLRAGLMEFATGPQLAFACFLLAAGHRASGEARMALARCHYAMPVRAFAPGCHVDAALYGARSALFCARVCWPGMLLPFVSSRPLLTMAIVTALAIADRAAFRAPTRKTAGALVVLAFAELLAPA
jgi:fumarate reductase subunit D